MLELPHGWELWGMDAQGGQMDSRQLEFFRSRSTGDGPPRRLILLTPEPLTVFGRCDAKKGRLLGFLGLCWPLHPESPRALPAA